MIASFTDFLRNLAGFDLNCDQFPATLGRGEGATIQLTDRWVSRTHCRIFVEGQHLVVLDLGSRHGTYVNGESVEEAILAPGDELQIGVNTFRVHYIGTELLSQTEHTHRDDSSVATSV